MIDSNAPMPEVRKEGQSHSNSRAHAHKNHTIHFPTMCIALSK